MIFIARDSRLDAVCEPLQIKMDALGLVENSSANCSLLQRKQANNFILDWRGPE
jgi:hypothetical protein